MTFMMEFNLDSENNIFSGLISLSVNERVTCGLYAYYGNNLQLLVFVSLYELHFFALVF